MAGPYLFDGLESLWLLKYSSIFQSFIIVSESTHSCRARGRGGGRKPALTPQRVREIKALLSDPSIPVELITDTGIEGNTLQTCWGRCTGKVSIGPEIGPRERGKQSMTKIAQAARRGRGVSPIYLNEDDQPEQSNVIYMLGRKRRRIVFGWYGGKFSHLDWLLPLLPKYHHYCEPFAGSGAVLINREASPVETYNDIDGDVVNFFRVLRDRHEELIRLNNIWQQFQSKNPAEQHAFGVVF